MMRFGKLDNDKLNELVLKRFKHIRDDVICSPMVGMDCAAVDLRGRLAVLSTDPITSAGRHLGRLTVHVSCNDAAAAGAEPIGLLVTLLVPPTACEADIAHVADELADAAHLAGVEIIGGHTEVTDSVKRMVTCATVIARAGENGVITPAGMSEGDDIVLTKYAGLEGTAVIASDFASRLHALAEGDLETARGFIELISVVEEGLYAARHGATAMHDVTEGGVLGAVWEMAYAAGVGIEIDAARIPVHPVTQRICATVDIDPLRLLSSGAMLIACSDGNELVDGLRGIGIAASVIGKAGGDGARLTDGSEIDAPQSDELYKLFS